MTQYQLTMPTGGLPGRVSVTMSAPATFDDLGFCAKRADYKAGLAATIDGLGTRSSIALWGGASNAVTICLTLPVAAEGLSWLIDINSRKQKQNCYLPNSTIPILSPEAAVATGIHHASVINPAYPDEIRKNVAALNPDLTIHSIAESRTV